MRDRLFMLLVVPAAAALVLASLIVVERNADYAAADTAFSVAALADEVAALDKALGDEALAASKLLQPEQPLRSDKRLEVFERTMRVTDAELGHVEAQLEAGSYHPDVAEAVNVVHRTLRFRRDVTAGTVSPLQILDRYSHLRTALLSGLSTEALVLKTAQSEQYILALIDLIEVRSAHLDERVGVDLARRYSQWAPGLHSAVVLSIAKHDIHLENANRFLFEADLAPSPDLQVWRDEIIVSADAPRVNAGTWSSLSDEWIAVLDAEIARQRARTTFFLAEAESSANSTRWATLIGVSLALLLAMLITSVVSVRLVRRMSIITKQARRMAAGATTSRTYPDVRGSDELGQLSAAFDEMIRHVDTRTRNQWIESSVLESIVQGVPIDEIMEQAAPLLGTDSRGNPLYRFAWDDPAAAERGEGEQLRRRPLVFADPDPVLAIPNSPELRTAVGLVTMAQQRNEDHTKLAWQATRDELTGLFNRGAVIGQALASIGGDASDGSGGDGDTVDDSADARAQPQSAMMYLDLDDFKGTNDQFGHAAGDQVLRALAIRLQESISEVGGVAGRLGGDEFLVLLPAVEDEAHLQRLADRIIADLSAPIPYRNGAFQIGVSIGGVLNRPGVPPLKLLNDADAALYQAKKDGRGRAVVSTQGLRDRIRETEQVRRDVLQGLDFDQFTPWYQPIWGPGGVSLVGVEALARWEHPERGLVPPAVFLPVAEELNLLSRLDRVMFEAVCRQVVAWRHSGLDLAMVHYNLSTAWLEEADFIDETKRVLAETGCPADAIVAEVTESGLMTDISSNCHRLQALREIGIRIAVDDFGQGYSSLAYLSDLPVDVLKIDRRFVDHIDREQANQSIVSAVVSLGGSLGLTIVAEGVERTEELAYLSAAGCDLFQGFLLAQPMPINETSALLGRRRHAGPSEAGEWLRQQETRGIERPADPVRVEPREEQR